jgi:hypothetical protein
MGDAFPVIVNGLLVLVLGFAGFGIAKKIRGKRQETLYG